MTQAIALDTLDGAYHVLESLIAERIAGITEPLFTTDAAGLYEAYLASFPVEARPYYTCHACRDFLQRYGGLVHIGADGTTIPALWSTHGVPEPVASVASNLSGIVARARVTGVFRWGADAWGTPRNVSPKTGVTWTHLSGTPRFAHSARNTLTPGQQMAALREDVGILSRSLKGYPIAAVEEAVRVLQSGTLMRSEKAEGVAVWFLALHRRRALAQPKARRNLTWRAVASAPPGFAHIRTTVLSTLLDDIVAGLPFAEVSRRWAEKLHPLQYQRPTAAPREGQIAAAERKVKDLGIERSLLRRFATLDDVLVKLWVPHPEAPAPAPTGGVFDMLRQETSAVKALELPAQVMTWEKFSRIVLPDAKGIDMLVPSHGGFYGLVTAADPDAPAIIQWDGLEGHPHNPVSWYFYNGGSSASGWGLVAGWMPVTAVFLPPFQWQEPARFAHQGRNVFFALLGARESRRSGLALFPEILRAELHDVRGVIEAYSNRTQIEGTGEGNANGLAFAGQGRVRLRVKGAGGSAVYDLDRWD